MTKNEALTKLKKIIDDIPNLYDYDWKSPELKKWQRETQIAISKIFNDYLHLQDFKKIAFYPSSTTQEKFESLLTKKLRYKNAMRYGLDTAKAILESMVDEINDYWKDEPSPSTILSNDSINKVADQSESSNEMPSINNPSTKINSRKVFVVHGRNSEIRDAIFSFLRSIDLDPMEWSEARRLTGNPNPYVGEILDAGFSNAQAALVLFTPDDEARLLEHFIKDDDEPHEKQLTPQPRQNVTFEAGMAMGKFPERTVLVQVGKVRPMSDISGLHILRLNNSSETRQELAERLKDAGCAVKIENKTNWHKEGNFELKALHSQETEIIKVKSISEQLPEEGMKLLEFLTENSNDDIGIWAADVLENSQIPKPKTLYYLDLFEEKGFVFFNMDFTKGKQYHITSDGRKYYFENI